MAWFQLISGDAQGLPTIKTLLACIATYVLPIYFWPTDINNGKNILYQKPTKQHDKKIKNLFTFYFLFFVVNMMICDPEDHMSTGIHQAVGDCKIYDTDMAGHQRQVFLCQNDFNEDFNFDCPKFKTSATKEQLEHGTEWYSVCSNPHSNKFKYVMVEALLGLVGTFVTRL